MPIAGRYEVLERLGVGGMGVVSRVRDRVTQRILAVKQPRWRGLAEWEPRLDPRTSLEREFRVLRQLDHPHIVRAHDFGSDASGEPFLVLDALDSVDSIAAAGRSAGRRECAWLLSQMFDAIHHVHSRGFVHRDIKPSNVLLCREAAPGVRLIDFGLARGVDEPATPLGEDDVCPPSLVGSVLYLAPELVDGHPASPASDLYAAGMVAAQVLTGLDPAQRAGPRATLVALRDLPRAWLGVAADVLGVDPRAMSLLRRLLARDPAARCCRADEAAHEMRALSRR